MPEQLFPFEQFGAQPGGTFSDDLTARLDRAGETFPAVGSIWNGLKMIDGAIPRPQSELDIANGTGLVANGLRALAEQSGVRFTRDGAAKLLGAMSTGTDLLQTFGTQDAVRATTFLQHATDRARDTLHTLPDRFFQS